MIHTSNIDRVITEVICFEFQVTSEDLKEIRENGKIVRSNQNAAIRRLIYYFYRETFPLVPLSEIPKKTLGIKQDHSTVIHAIRTVNNQLDYDKSYVKIVDRLRILVLSAMSEVRGRETLLNMIQGVEGCARL